MAKRPTLTDVTGFTGATSVNNNSNSIEEAFDNTLSRDGSAPNNMTADLDMDSNDILNVGNMSTSTLSIGGTVVVPSTAATFASPTLTGTPVAPTATEGTNTTQVATTEFVTTAVAGAGGGGGGSSFSTLSEPTRALATVYQNTTGEPRLVVACINDAADEKAVLVSDDNFVSSNIQIAYVGGAGDQFANFTFVVPDGWYYQIISNGVGLVVSWVEYN